MSGIVGMFGVGPSTASTAATFLQLLQESRARGTHSLGMAWVYRDGRHGVGRVQDFATLKAIFRGMESAQSLPEFMIGEAWYCTSGNADRADNHPPLMGSGVYLALDGVIDSGFRRDDTSKLGISCITDNDAEIFLRRLERGETPLAVLSSIAGSLAAVWLHVLAPGDVRGYAIRNAKRPLWMVKLADRTLFASTRDIFRRCGFSVHAIVALEPGVLWQTA